TPRGDEVALLKRVHALSGAPDAETLAALQAHAELSQSILAERAGKLEQEAAQLRKLAVGLHRQTVQDELAKLLEQPEEKLDLFHAALLVSKLDNADVDVDAYRAHLGEMARELKTRLPAKAGDAAKLSALNQYLFTENG